MAPSVPPLPSETPRPLPRRNRSPGSVRTPRPRLLAVDIVWMLILAAGAGVLGVCLRVTPLNCAINALTVVLLYLLGWRARDRATGVIAALLLAASLPYWAHATTIGGLIALLTVTALFAFVAGTPLIGIGLAALATLLRPDLALLALLLIGFTLAQRHPRASLGILAFLVIAIGGWTARFFVLQHILPTPTTHPDLRVVRWMFGPAMAFLTWFLLPFAAEFGEAPRRARWLPIVLGAILLGLSASVLQFSPPAQTLIPFMPLLFVLIAGGIARLLPTLAGEFPIPALRYVIATLAVLSLLAIRARQEWPPLPITQTVAAQRPTTPPHERPIRPAVRVRPVIVHAAPAASQGSVVTVPLHIVPVHAIAAPHTKTASARAAPAVRHTARPAVPVYFVKNGVRVRRSKWAIQWDRTHPRH